MIVYRDRHDTIQAHRGIILSHSCGPSTASKRHTILYRAVIGGRIVEDDMNEAGTP